MTAAKYEYELYNSGVRMEAGLSQCRCLSPKALSGMPSAEQASSLSLPQEEHCAPMTECKINKVTAAQADLCWGNRTRLSVVTPQAN